MKNLNFLGNKVTRALLLAWGDSPSRRDEYEELIKSWSLEPSWIDLRKEKPDLRNLKGTLLIFTGGKDIHPSRWGEEIIFPDLEKIDEERDEAEFKVMEEAVKLKLPILGICRGMQLINVFFGGTLFHDMNSELSGVVVLCDAHQQASMLSPEAKRRLAHQVFLKREISDDLKDLLHHLKATHGGFVTSRHHQAVRKLGDGLEPICYAKDGIVEAVYHRELPILGVQWHPESPLPDKYRTQRRERIEVDIDLEDL